MGWIAALKQGSPAFGSTSEVKMNETDDSEDLPLNKTASVVFITSTTGDSALKLPSLGSEAKGMVLTALAKTVSGGTVTVGPKNTLSGDVTGERTAKLSAAGESAQFLWDGDKWNFLDALAGAMESGSDIAS